MSASPRFIVVALLIALAAQIAIYWPTLHQIPFGDDWGPPLTEIVRGERLGPLNFFTETRQPDSYRPMQSLLIWLFGRVDEGHRWASIRVLHFLSSAVAFVVLGLLLRQWRFGRAGVVVAAAVGALHPSLVAPVGSIDGFSSVVACAAVWWGVWMMWRWPDRPAIGITLACLALVVGTLVKEYAFAMAPTAVLAAWFLYRPRWRHAVVTAVVLGTLTFLLLWVRRYTKPTDMGPIEADFSPDSILMLAQNAALVLVGGFFLGDSLWLYVERSPLAAGVAGAVFAATMGLLCVGLYRRVRATPASPAKADADSVADENNQATQTSPLRDPRWLIGFLILSIPAVTFPANVVMRISEMYLCGMVFTVALLCGLAADGFSGNPSRGRRVAAASLGTLLAIAAACAVRHKIGAMVALGVRTRAMTDAILAEANGLSEGSRVALFFRKDQVPARATFSSFRLPDCFLVRPPAADYLFAGRKLTLVCPSTVSGAELPLFADESALLAADRSIADVVLYWDVARARFTRLK